MQDKPPTRMSQSVVPNASKYSGFFNDKKVTQRVDVRQIINRIENDLPNLKILKSDLNNPTIASKAKEYYMMTNKLKPKRQHHVSQVSINSGLIDPDILKLAQKTTTTESQVDTAPDQRNELDQLITKYSTTHENRINPLHTKSAQSLDLRGMKGDVLGRSKSGGTFRIYRKIANNAKSLAISNTKPEAATLYKPPQDREENNNSKNEGDSPLPMEKSSSTQKLRQSNFFSYVRFQSPRQLLQKQNRQGQTRLESGISQRVRNSLPMVEQYCEIANRMFAVGRKPPPLYTVAMNKEYEELVNCINQNSSETKQNNPPLAAAQDLKTLMRVTSYGKMNEESAKDQSVKALNEMFMVSGSKKTLQVNPLKSIRTEESPRKVLLRGSTANPLSPNRQLAFEEYYRNQRTATSNQRPGTQGNPYLNFEENAVNRQATNEETSENEDIQGSNVLERKNSLSNFKVARNNRKGESFSKTFNGSSLLGSAKKTTKPQEPAIDPQLLKLMKAYREFLLKINYTFNMQVKPISEKPYASYKFYIEKGNNHMLIRALMKTRWWWSQTDSKNPKDINLMWTQNRNKFYIESLPPIQQQQEYQTNKSDSSDDTPKPRRRTKSLREKEEDQNDYLVVDPQKRLFTKKEKASIDENIELFKAGVLSKEFEDLCKAKTGANYKEITDTHSTRMCNHVEDNFNLGNKKALLVNMRSYYKSIGDDVTNYLPLTFHIKKGLEDEEFQRFVECYNQREKEIQQDKDDEKANKKLRNLWIVKPGEDTNKGKGISLVNSLEEVKEFIGTSKVNNQARTYLIQLYLDKPLLYNRRKFDIRCYMMISCINGVYKGYWYQEGYIRTSSKEFTLKNTANKQIHLTNDAIQKKFDDYGKWECGNKVSWTDFEKYLKNTYNGTVDFNSQLYPQMKRLATDTMKAVYGIVDKNKRENTFEVFGLDFMIDTNFKVWLIEVNTNPDITIPSPKLGILIPNMVENALRLTIDPLFPPPNDFSSKKHTLPENPMENNRFELVFDETEEGEALRETLKVRQEALRVLSSQDPNLDEDETDEDNKD